MSPEEFRAALEASRRFEVDCLGAKFALVLPTQYMARSIWDKGEIAAIMHRRFAEISIVGWSGVKMSHVLPDGPQEELPFTPENVALLLEHRQRVSDELASAIAVKIGEHRDKLEGAKKNSRRGSTGS